MVNSIFVDTSGFFALLSTKDADHQAFSFTDCSSFCIMRRQGLTRALTQDRHFAVEGFVPLLG